MLKRIILLQTFLLLSFPPLKNALNCKTLIDQEECTSNKDCKGNKICYGDLEKPTYANFSADGYCCDAMRCTITGLKSFYRIDGDKGMIFRHVYYNTGISLDSKRYYTDTVSDIACAYPYSYATAGWYFHYPVDFNGTKEEYKVMTCTVNSDCGIGRYCGYSVNPFYDEWNSGKTSFLHLDLSDDGKPMQFCYNTPPLPDDNTELVSNPEGLAFSMCDTNTECASPTEFCHHLENGSAVLRNTHGTKKKGVCVRYKLCEDPYNLTTVYGSLTANREQCSNSTDCLGVPGFSDDAFEKTCVPYNMGMYHSGNLCCFSVKKCAFGVSKIPLTKCESNDDCNDRHLSPTSWCDKGGMCCHGPSNSEFGYCPDQNTFAFNEEPCIGSDPSNITSGTCPQSETAWCQYGHCCPQLKYQDSGMAPFPELSYITNTSCDPEKAVPKNYVYAFCWTKISKIVIIGKTDGNGTSLLDFQSTCSSNIDCLNTKWQYCVRYTNESSYCHLDPFGEYVEEEVDPSIWTQFKATPLKKILSIFLVFIFVFLVWHIVVVCCIMTKISRFFNYVVEPYVSKTVRDFYATDNDQNGNSHTRQRRRHHHEQRVDSENPMGDVV